MAVVVVGGQSRKAGKTSVIAGLLSALPELNWTAIKITPHEHGLAADHSYDISEETDRSAPKDTSRYLAAGARQALLVRLRPGGLAAAMPEIRQRLARAQNAIVESNAILDFLRPELCIAVLDASIEDFKLSLENFLPCADALVTVGQSGGKSSNRVFDLMAGKPVFQARPPQYATPELVEFVRQRITPAG